MKSFMQFILLALLFVGCFTRVDPNLYKKILNTIDP